MSREIIFLPGAMRLAPDLKNVADLGRVSGYPGQGLPLVPSMDYESMLAEVAKDIDPSALVVGESLGGLFALGLPNPVIAIDPPLETAKLWYVRRALVNEARRINRRPLTEMMVNIFGYHLDWTTENRTYHHLLQRSAPTWIISATVPMNPPREHGPDPGLLDNDDRQRIRDAGIPLFIVDGPHGLIDARTEEVRRIILEVRDVALPALAAATA